MRVCLPPTPPVAYLFLVRSHARRVCREDAVEDQPIRCSGCVLHLAPSAGVVLWPPCRRVLGLLRYGSLRRERLRHVVWLYAFCSDCFSRPRHSDSLFALRRRYWPVAECRRRRCSHVDYAALRIRL